MEFKQNVNKIEVKNKNLKAWERKRKSKEN